MQDESYFELRLSNTDLESIKKAVPSKEQYCPHFLKCGGCQLLNWDYEKQVEWKGKQMEALCNDIQLTPKPFLKAETILAYRHKNTYTLKAFKTQILGGFYAMNSKNLVTINHCLIQDKKAEVIFNSLKTILKQQKQQVYEPDYDEGYLKHIVIRVSSSTDEIMVILVNASSEFPGRKNVVTALRKAHPEITSIYENTNPEQGPYVLSNTNRLLYGRETLTDKMGGLTFHLGPSSFFQVHPSQAEMMFKEALSHLDLRPTDTLVDLYCGVGVMALMCADKVKNVIGIESNPVAVKFATENATLNQINNAKFYKKKVDEYMGTAEGADIVLMDPPREGASMAFINNLIKMNPRQILYISCNPLTQVRDLKQLALQYKVTWIQGVDLFPQTKHIESFAILEKKVRRP
jgi:23S rRNA (uracil1939-C5)-methyltransferase